MRLRGRRAAAAVGVVFEGRVWGELYLTRDQLPGFTTDDVLVLELLAAQLRAMRSLLSLATSSGQGEGHDALTGLPLRQAIDRAVRHSTQKPLVVAAFDVDGLKGVNDQYGHAAGDRLIVAAAAAVRETVGTMDGATVGRLGGDEFAAVVEGVDPGVVERACAEAMRRLAQFLPTASMSCGVASSSDLRGSIGSGRPLLLRLADATLYRAKKAGLSVPLRSWSPPITSSTLLRHLAADQEPEAVRYDVPVDQLARLSDPVDVFCRLVDGAAWWISWVPPRSRTLVVVATPCGATGARRTRSTRSARPPTWTSSPGPTRSCGGTHCGPGSTTPTSTLPPRRTSRSSGTPATSLPATTTRRGASGSSRSSPTP